jgi:ketosteroid isomerase-like protein
MSKKNVARFLETNEVFNRGDLDAWLLFYDEECVFQPQAAALEGTFDGHDGLRRFFANIAERFESFEVEFDDVRDLGDRVLALGVARGRGRGSGIKTEGRVAVVAAFRGGKCIHFKDYGDRDQALEPPDFRSSCQRRTSQSFRRPLTPS